MVSGHDEDSQLARALAGGKPHPTGWFRLYFEDELRVLAEQLLADFRALNYDDTLPARPVFDQLLLTAHNRVRR